MIPLLAGIGSASRGLPGRPLTRVRNLGTHFTAPKTYHSAKPNVFYQMVERTSYPPYLDVFARKRRPGWTVWGSGIAEARLGALGTTKEARISETVKNSPLVLSTRLVVPPLGPLTEQITPNKTCSVLVRK